MDKISIVIPIYNKERHLENTIRCILRQTYANYECILVDDGSTDSSGKICDQFAAKDKRFQVIHQENRGVSGARNRGILESTGTYICFIDADDIPAPAYLEQLYRAISENKAELAICDYFQFRKGEKQRHGLRPFETDLELYEIIRYDLLCVLWNKLFVREKIVHLFEEGISNCEDAIFCLRYYLDQHPRIAWVEEPLYQYNLILDSVSHRLQPTTEIGIWRMCELFKKLSEEIADTRRKKAAQYHLAKVVFYAFYTYIFENMDTRYLHLKKKQLSPKQMRTIDLQYESLTRIFEDARYRKLLKYLLKNCSSKKKVEGFSLKESAYLMMSLCKWKWGLLFMVELRRKRGLRKV